jgi:hypothetical protein
VAEDEFDQNRVGWKGRWTNTTTIEISLDMDVFAYPRPRLIPSFSTEAYTSHSPPPLEIPARSRSYTQLTSSASFSHTSPNHSPQQHPNLLSLPSELLLEIALFTYSPLYLSQQDRTTWSIFSTVDMDPARWAGLETLISLAATCRRIRDVCRGLLFRCVRISNVESAVELIRAKDVWGKWVK